MGLFCHDFALVKINRVQFLPDSSCFCQFFRGTPLLVQLMLGLLWDSSYFKAINQSYGTAFNINAIPAELLVWLLPLMRAAYAVRPSSSDLSVDPGEIEAARSLGMTNRQVYRGLLFPMQQSLQLLL